MKITGLQTSHLRLPLGRSRLSLTDPAPARPDVVDVLLVRLDTDAGLQGLGFTAVVGLGGAALRSLLENDLPSLVVGEDPLAQERLLAKVRHRARGAGWSGLLARAYAAIDIAIWDLKGKAAGMPLFRLLGGAQASAAVFVSDVTTPDQSADDALRAAKPLLDQGAGGLLVQVGSPDPEADADRVQRVRQGLPEGAWLGVTAEGRYDLWTASAIGHFFEDELGVDWFEEPVPVEDRAGYARLEAKLDLPLAAGATLDQLDDFRRLLEGGSVRVLRPDVLRLGGITPWLKVAALAEAYPVTVSPYRPPEVGVHLACGLPNVEAVEAVGWLSPLFAEPLRIAEGRVLPTERPGLGLEPNPEALAKHGVTG